MSLDVIIKFKESRKCNFFLDHPYIYSGLSDRDKENFSEEDSWWGNITHNLGEMARQVPIDDTTLYMVCWRPEEIGLETVGQILPLLIKGIHYMIDHRKELLEFESPNGWGTYNGFMKFLLNYKQACEDNDPECKIYADK